MKSFRDILKRDPQEMMKNMFIKKYPHLQGVDFDFKQQMSNCVICGDPKIPEYYIKREKDVEFKKVPMDPGTCIACEDKQLARQAKESHKRMQSERITSQFWIVPPELERQSLATYKAEDKQQRNAFKDATDYLKNFENGDHYNLVLRGSYGGGKSHLLKGVAEAVRKMTKTDKDGDQVPLTVGFLELEKLLAMIKGTWGRRDGQSEFDIIKLVVELDFLVIDDLGTESGEWAGKKLFEIINGRLGKATAVTMNFMEMDELAERYPMIGGKIVSRLHFDTKIVDLVTNDMRMKKQRG